MRLFYLVIAVVILAACQKEAALSPSPVKLDYTLPQGSNSYDDSIVALNKKYNVYILYKFSQADYAYSFTDVKTDTAFMPLPNYISTGLRFLYEHVFNTYTEAFMQKTMPYKILLADSISKSSIRNVTGFSATTSMLAVAWANPQLSQKTPTELKQLRGWMHRFYMERAYRAGSLMVPDDFAALAPFYANLNATTKYAAGVVAQHGNELNLAQDFLAYIEMITKNSNAELEATLFKPNIDTKGLIRKKYNIILHYFQQEYGMDLQAIGDRP